MRQWKKEFEVLLGWLLLILGSQVGYDPQNFIDEVKKILKVMQVTDNGSIGLASYKLKDVSDIW